MNKKEFFASWGFNDVPLEKDFSIYILYPFDFITDIEGHKLWFNKHLPKLSKEAEYFSGDPPHADFILIFKNNKLVKIYT